MTNLIMVSIFTALLLPCTPLLAQEWINVKGIKTGAGLFVGGLECLGSKGEMSSSEANSRRIAELIKKYKMSRSKNENADFGK